jgi:hypothetical protein
MCVVNLNSLSGVGFMTPHIMTLPSSDPEGLMARCDGDDSQTQAFAILFERYPTRVRTHMITNTGNVYTQHSN